MRKQYHLKKSPQGLLAWDVHRLIELSQGFAVKQIPLSMIKETEEPYWFDYPPTCRQLLEHMQLVESADLLYPIILNSEGRVMDGMHRVLKALRNGDEYINAVRFVVNPEPDYIGIDEKDLPY